jgi:hypothetical protein
MKSIENCKFLEPALGFSEKWYVKGDACNWIHKA